MCNRRNVVGATCGLPKLKYINVYGYAGQGDQRVAPTVIAKIKMSVVIIFLKETILSKKMFLYANNVKARPATTEL